MEVNTEKLEKIEFTEAEKLEMYKAAYRIAKRVQRLYVTLPMAAKLAGLPEYLIAPNYEIFQKVVDDAIQKGDI